MRPSLATQHCLALNYTFSSRGHITAAATVQCQEQAAIHTAAMVAAMVAALLQLVKKDDADDNKTCSISDTCRSVLPCAALPNLHGATVTGKA